MSVPIHLLVDQVSVERVEMPRQAYGECTDGAVQADAAVPILRPRPVSGVDDARGTGEPRQFTEMQPGAPAEVANIGAGPTATALSTLIEHPIAEGSTARLSHPRLKPVAQLLVRLGVGP